MTEKPEQSKAQKVVGAIFGILGLITAGYLIYLGIELLFV